MMDRLYAKILPIKTIKREPIYLLDYQMPFRLFKKLQDNLVRHDVYAVGFDETLYNLMAERQLLCWFDPEVDGDMKIGRELPECRDVLILAHSGATPAD